MKNCLSKIFQRKGQNLAKCHRIVGQHIIAATLDSGCVDFHYTRLNISKQIEKM